LAKGQGKIYYVSFSVSKAITSHEEDWVRQFQPHFCQSLFRESWPLRVALKCPQKTATSKSTITDAISLIFMRIGGAIKNSAIKEWRQNRAADLKPPA